MSVIPGNSPKWETVKKYSRRAGKEGMALAEATYLTLRDPSVSWTHKAALGAALMYLLSPLDGMPDFLPGGYVDDISVLLGALLGVGTAGRKNLAKCRQKHGLKPKADAKTTENLEKTTDKLETK